MLDCTQLSYEQMADIVRAIKMEVINRLDAAVNQTQFKQSCNDVILDLDTFQEN